MSAKPWKLRVERAEVMGLCFGVRDALREAFARPDAEDVTIYGELVHNEEVRGQLAQAGFKAVSESDRSTEVATEKVLVTAHGLSNRESARLREAGHELIDTTCPLVRKAHHAALRLREAGYFPVVIGQPGHVEVRGLVGDLDEFAVVSTVAEAAAVARGHARVGVLSQTTFPEPEVLAIVAELRRVNPDAVVRFYNTVCEPTRQRRLAVEELAGRVEVMVIVGGQKSNNSLQLQRVAQAAGARAFLVQGPEDLQAEWFVGCSAVGLSAGTSTLDSAIDAVEVALRRLQPAIQAPVG